MKLEYLKYAFDNVLHRKMRSWLTIISILIGIAAIYALVSFGQGLSSYISDLSEEMGADKLVILAKSVGAPGTDLNFYITANDIDFVNKINGVEEGAGLYFKSVEVEYKDIKKYVFLISMPVGPIQKLVNEMFTIEIGKGRELKRGDKFKVVLGYNYQLSDKIFSKPLKLGDKLTVNGQKVEVIGFYESVGNPQDDSNVYLTEDVFELMFPDTVDKFQMGILRAAPAVDTVALAAKAEEKLRKHKGQEKGKEDFYIQTYEQLIETFTNVMDVINAVLVLIALVSLIVAGINIMNTMYTSVMERTKEIGIMKSVGAKNSDILLIFLFESGILGLIGGALGVVFGYIIASIGGEIAATAGYSMLQPAFPLWLTIGCLLFAFIVGAAAGAFPARQASKLKPVDALRYE